ncbi:hypothetical protein [Roseomonas populi]|uniref:Galectin domain-containing protein n=1 Tax=Roseomonas populi TaxID=3121582 RepID=A0ABT1X6E4_9PROT|nr:hypothetical protein [Roseomonas pecuniae]MCR0983676.1 hypothetical protein [Roseomonas pecuniae]
MDLPLQDPPVPGSVHRFSVRFPAHRPQVIDYLDEDTIHLHVSLRPAEGVIVLNDFVGGAWSHQVELPLPKLALGQALPLEVHFGAETLEVRAGSGAAAFAGRRGSASEARLLRTSDGVSLLGEALRTPGTAIPAAIPSTGARFAGAIDRCSETLVRGWVADLDRPDSPVQVEIRVDGQLQGRTLAHRRRNDLTLMRPEFGATGFLFLFPRPLAPTGRDVQVAVHVAGQPVELAHSPWLVFRAVPGDLQPLSAPLRASRHAPTQGDGGESP